VSKWCGAKWIKVSNNDESCFTGTAESRRRRGKVEKVSLPIVSSEALWQLRFLRLSESSLNSYYLATVSMGSMLDTNCGLSVEFGRGLSRLTTTPSSPKKRRR